MKTLKMVALFMAIVFVPIVVYAGPMTGEGPNLGSDRITQDQIESGLSLEKIREKGEIVFTTPFNKHDGYGDGPFDPSEDPLLPGGRSTLQGNGTFLRVNGLDAQSCSECHFIARHSTIPMTFGIGGVSGSNSNAIFMPTSILFFISTFVMNP